jgi:hypothetical protein
MLLALRHRLYWRESPHMAYVVVGRIHHSQSAVAQCACMHSYLKAGPFLSIVCLPVCPSLRHLHLTAEAASHLVSQPW